MGKGVTPTGPGSRASHGAAKASPPKASIPNAELAIEACRLGVLYDDMLRRYSGPISQYGALLGGEMPNIDAAYDAWATAARRAVGAPILPLPEGAPNA